MDIVSRLKTFIDYLGIPYSAFADQAQITRPTLSQILNGRNKKISNELISKLHAAFPSLNILWLMFGDGDMIIGNVPGAENLNAQGAVNVTQQVGGTQRAESSHGFDINLFDIDEGASRGVKMPVSSVNSAPELTENKVVDASQKPGMHNASMSENSEKKKEKSFWDDISSENTIVDERKFGVGANKSVSYIMVFYSDNSYEMFRPQRDDAVTR